MQSPARGARTRRDVIARSAKRVVVLRGKSTRRGACRISVRSAPLRLGQLLLWWRRRPIAGAVSAAGRTARRVGQGTLRGDEPARRKSGLRRVPVPGVLLTLDRLAESCIVACGKVDYGGCALARCSNEPVQVGRAGSFDVSEWFVRFGERSTGCWVRPWYVAPLFVGCSGNRRNSRVACTRTWHGSRVAPQTKGGSFGEP